MADRETSLEERERKDKEKADSIRERQERLGHVEKKAKRGRPKKSETDEETSEE